jgi:hypothetical protein
MRWISVVAGLVYLLGCASVSTIVTGEKRPAIDPSTVKLYSRPPHQFEDVALVTAEANSGWTEQAQVDNAIAGLRKKAAQLGANGVLIEAAGKQGGGAVAIPTANGGFVLAPIDRQAVQGRAIFVTQE